MRRLNAMAALAGAALAPLVGPYAIPHAAAQGAAHTAPSVSHAGAAAMPSDVTTVAADAPVRIIGHASADAYVEARLRPVRAGGDGRAYVVARYQDQHNWYGAGLNFQSATGRMQVEIVRMQDGQLTRLKQFSRAAPADVRFYTVRLEVAGTGAATTLTAYLNGERITSVVDPAPPAVLSRSGSYGLVATGAAFEASTPVTGDAADKPARLALARAPQRVQLSVGDPAMQLPVSALGAFRLAAGAAVGNGAVKPPAAHGADASNTANAANAANAASVPVTAGQAAMAGPRFLTPGAVQDAALSAASNGAKPLRFGAAAAQPALVEVQVVEAGGPGGSAALRLLPRAPGITTVTLTSLDDPNVFSVVEVQVAAASAPRDTGIRLGGAVTPASGERNVPWDTPLRLRFDAPPTLGTSGGAIRVYRKRDGTLVDSVRTGGESDLLGYERQPYRRALRLQPIALEGREAIIHLHSDRLQAGEDYLVTVDDGVFNGAIGGKPFGGVTRAQGWSFRTRATLPQGAQFVVDDDGPADFRTVQGALNYAMQHTARSAPVTVTIRAGRYQEQLYLRGKDNLTLRGESRDHVVIDALNSDGVNPGSGTAQDAQSAGIVGGRAVFLIEDADLITLDSLTLRNSTLRASPTGGQAEALFFNSEGRLIAKNASFFSEQDTIQVRGYSWFYRTLVAGNVDFIWGNNRAALFEDSEIRTLGDSGNGRSGGYVLQARTVSAGDRGFMFVNSRLTHGPGPTGNDVPAGATWLARSPGYANTWDHIAFINCRMGPHIAPAGWAGPATAKQPAPNPAQASATAGWREAGSMDLDGKPLDLGRRTHGSVLDAAQAAAAYGSRAQFFAAYTGYGGEKGWNPQP